MVLPLIVIGLFGVATAVEPFSRFEDSVDEIFDTREIDQESALPLSTPEALRAALPDETQATVLAGPFRVLADVIPGARLYDRYRYIFDRSAVLNDYDSRISPAFDIPMELRDRVAFWFDIYTKYDSNQRVVHHSLHPWIVYKVVDVHPIIASKTPRRLWMRREKANKFAQAEGEKVKVALSNIASGKSSRDFNEDEAAVARALAQLGGNLRSAAKVAMENVRIQTGQHNFFVEGLKTSDRLLPQMERIFRERKLPVELTRLPFVESSFNKHATSKVGAAGIWQFMDNTGRKFMLVDGPIDERRSPLKATEAAALVLKENHMILYRSWPLAVTAWNHGPGRVKKAARAMGTRDLGKIVGRFRSRTFDFASSNFYSEFLAALHAERYAEQIFGHKVRHTDAGLKVVRLARAIRFNRILEVSGLSLEDFLAINPDLAKVAKNNLLVPEGFRIHVPDSAMRGLRPLIVAERQSERGAKSRAKI